MTRTEQYNQLFSFMWNIANDVLVHVFEKGDYKKVILPMMVLRRIDVLLEPTKEQVITRHEQLEGKVQNEEPLLTRITGYPFYNTSKFTLKSLKSETDPKRLRLNFEEYMQGYSKDVIDIFQRFKLMQQVESLSEVGRLGAIIEKFTDQSINLSVNPVLDDKGNEILPGLDNHMMGTIFEELLRKFNEENNVTEAGEHFTPRDYVKLLGDLAIIPVINRLKPNTYSIYDGACGTGGILTIAQDEIHEEAKKHGIEGIHTMIFGQELQADTYATCKSDLMISGHQQTLTYNNGSEMRPYIGFGSTISRDQHPGVKFDFCISNPPFGTSWKEDVEAWGLKDKKEITDTRFVVDYDNNPRFSFVPNIGDPQMLFLANNISRMREDTEFGTRIVEVHNGSSLFTGDAGDGESNRSFSIM